MKYGSMSGSEKLQAIFWILTQSIVNNKVVKLEKILTKVLQISDSLYSYTYVLNTLNFFSHALN